MYQSLRPIAASLTEGVSFFSSLARNLSTTNITTLPPHPIPQLELIDSMVAKAKEANLPDLKRTAFIGAQHILETTSTLFKGLIDIGIKPENMYFTGKCYSTSPTVAQSIRNLGVQLISDPIPKVPGQYFQSSETGLKSLWQYLRKNAKKNGVKKLVLLDDGGRSFETMPEDLRFNGHEIAGIEQTRGGLYNRTLQSFPFPLISVASSAAKILIEPPLIAQAILNKIIEFLPNLNIQDNIVCGIAGMGAVGSALARYLLKKGYKVVAYDPNDNAFQNTSLQGLYRLDSLESLIVNSRYIFGCTGLDITKNTNLLDWVANEKTFISCTSEDREFLTLLKQISERTYSYAGPLHDVSCVSAKGKKFIIKHGGFPINFLTFTTNSTENIEQKMIAPWNVPAQDIEITQGALFGACLQAMTAAVKPYNDGITANSTESQCLDPFVQRYIATKWGERQPRGRYPDGFFKQFEDIDWIRENSGGIYHPNRVLEECFGNIQKQLTDAPQRKMSP